MKRLSTRLTLAAATNTCGDWHPPEWMSVAVQATGQFELRDWNDTHLHGKSDLTHHSTLALLEGVAKSAVQQGFPRTRFMSRTWNGFSERQMDPNDLLEYEALANYIWIGREGPVNPVICTYDLHAV